MKHKPLPHAKHWEKYYQYFRYKWEFKTSLLQRAFNCVHSTTRAGSARVAFPLDCSIVKNIALASEKIVSSSYIKYFRNFTAKILLGKQIGTFQ